MRGVASSFLSGDNVARFAPKTSQPSLVYPSLLHTTLHFIVRYMDRTGLPTRSAMLHTVLLKTRLTAIKSSKDTDTHKEEDTNCCVICLEQVNEKAQAQPCQHSTFDFICLASWVQERSCCPLCNSEILTIHYAFTESGEHKVYTVASTSRSSSQTTPQVSALPRTPIRHTRLRRPYITRPALQSDDVIARRRRVYRADLYSLHVGTNRISCFRDFTPQTFSSDRELQSRARKWIRRELRVFEYLYPTPATGSSAALAASDRRANNAEFLLEYIIALLKTVDIQGPAGQATEMLQEFIGREHAMLFLHELRAWLRSPYTNLEDWDRNVQYAQDVKRTTEAAPPPVRGGTEPRDRAPWSTSRSERYSPYQHRGGSAADVARRRHVLD